MNFHTTVTFRDSGDSDYWKTAILGPDGRLWACSVGETPEQSRERAEFLVHAAQGYHPFAGSVLRLTWDCPTDILGDVK